MTYLHELKNNFIFKSSDPACSQKSFKDPRTLQTLLGCYMLYVFSLYPWIHYIIFSFVNETFSKTVNCLCLFPALLDNCGVWSPLLCVTASRNRKGSSEGWEGKQLSIEGGCSTMGNTWQTRCKMKNSKLVTVHCAGGSQPTSAIYCPGLHNTGSGDFFFKDPLIKRILGVFNLTFNVIPKRKQFNSLTKVTFSFLPIPSISLPCIPVIASKRI